MTRYEPEVINIWKGSRPLPALPRSKPVPVFPLSLDGLDTDRDAETTVFLAIDKCDQGGCI